MTDRTRTAVQIAVAVLAVGGALWYAMRPHHHRHAESPEALAAETGDAIGPPADVAAPPARATRTASGLAYVVLRPGTGTRHPVPTDHVSVHYTGWTTDGHEFDSSVRRGEPAEFPLDHVIAGWTEGVQLMTEGEKVRFWIPAALAYDAPGRPPRAGVPHGMLVFDVELLHIVTPPGGAPTPLPTAPHIVAPDDVAAPPATATHTPSGLAYRELAPGTGTAHPTATSTVTVQYTGWTTDGQMFDSSVIRGQPVTFPLARVIPGWTEGLQLMVEGQRMRFWIPGNLAYDRPGMAGPPGAPHGTLVFDVQLLHIQ